MDKRGQAIVEVLLVLPLLILVGSGFAQVYSFCRDAIHLQHIVCEAAREESLRWNSSAGSSDLWVLKKRLIRSMSIQQELWHAPWIQD